MPADKQNKKPKSTSDKPSSFKDDREKALAFLWNKIPARLRIPVALIITLIIALISTRSSWYPFIDSILNKPPERMIFDGYVFLHDMPVRSIVKLASPDGNIIRTEESDEFGHVVFNVEKNRGTYELQCLYEEVAKSFEFKFASLQSNSEFRIYLDQDSIAWK